MSLCYYPKNKIKPHCPTQYDHGGWDVNVAGAELLGGLHEQLGLPMSKSSHVLRVPYVLDDAGCKAVAQKLAETSDEDIKATFAKYSYCWEQTETAADDYLQWVRDWQKFLEICGGYDTEG